MATIKELQSKIKVLEKGLKSKATKPALKVKMRQQVAELKTKVRKLEKEERVSATDDVAKAKALAKKRRSQQTRQSLADKDIESDANRYAINKTRRISKGGRANQYGTKSENKGGVYYESRENRYDRQNKRYAKLEHGGEVSLHLTPKEYRYVVLKLDDLYGIGDSKEVHMDDLWNAYSEIPLPMLETHFKSDSDMMVALKNTFKKNGWEIEMGDEMAHGGSTYAKGGKLDVGVYRVGKPTKVSPNLYEQKIVEIFDNGDIATASDYARKLSDFKVQKYPIISNERLEEQYKYSDGGSTYAKGGELVPYIIWVSKDGNKRELYGTYKSQRAAEMAMKKLWDNSDYKEMGNKPKSMYDKEGIWEDGGIMDFGGTKYSSEDLSGMFANGGETHRLEDSTYAKGGAIEHGLKVGDLITFAPSYSTSISVRNNGESFNIDLNSGRRVKVN